METKSQEQRAAMKANPTLWVADEIKEMRRETLHSPNWCLEFLDVLGLLIMHGDALMLETVDKLNMKELEFPILTSTVRDWNAKNAKKDRKPISIEDLKQVRDELLAIKRGMKAKRHIKFIK